MASSASSLPQIRQVKERLLKKKYLVVLQELQSLDELLVKLETEYQEGITLAEQYYYDQIHEQINMLEDCCRHSLHNIILWFGQLENLVFEFKDEWMQVVKEYYRSLALLDTKSFEIEMNSISDGMLNLNIMAFLQLDNVSEFSTKRRKLDHSVQSASIEALRKAERDNSLSTVIREHVELAWAKDPCCVEQQKGQIKIKKFKWMLNYDEKETGT